MKYPYIWCKRIRHRCGFGVQSPSDFYLITQVIYEHLPFYSYSSIHELHKNRLLKSKLQCKEKIDRLLFRLVNFYQPKSVVVFEANPSCSTFAIACANRKAKVFSFSEVLDTDEEQKLKYNFLPDNVSFCNRKTDISITLPKIDFLFVESSDDFSLVFENFYFSLSDNAVCVFNGIYATSERKKKWKKIVADHRATITFDLYEVGIVLFREDRIKQNYIVSF